MYLTKFDTLIILNIYIKPLCVLSIFVETYWCLNKVIPDEIRKYYTHKLSHIIVMDSKTY